MAPESRAELLISILVRLSYEHRGLTIYVLPK